MNQTPLHRIDSVRNYLQLSKRTLLRHLKAYPGNQVRTLKALSQHIQPTTDMTLGQLYRYAAILDVQPYILIETEQLMGLDCFELRDRLEQLATKFENLAEKVTEKCGIYSLHCSHENCLQIQRLLDSALELLRSVMDIVSKYIIEASYYNENLVPEIDSCRRRQEVSHRTIRRQINELCPGRKLEAKDVRNLLDPAKWVDVMLSDLHHLAIIFDVPTDDFFPGSQTVSLVDAKSTLLNLFKLLNSAARIYSEPDMENLREQVLTLFPGASVEILSNEFHSVGQRRNPEELLGRIADAITTINLSNPDD